MHLAAAFNAFNNHVPHYDLFQPLSGTLIFTHAEVHFGSMNSIFYFFHARALVERPVKKIKTHF